MGDVRFRMNPAGARALLGSRAAADMVGGYAERCAAACNAEASPDDMRNEPFGSSAKAGGARARASVFTASPHGFNHNAKNDTILRNL